MTNARRRRTLALTANAGVLGAFVLFATLHARRELDRAPAEVPSVAAPPDLSPAPAPEFAASAVAAATSVTTSALAPSAAPAAAAFDEAELMRLLRSARGNDPGLAVELAREGNRRFPTSPDAPERASSLIHALTEQGHASEARGEAEDMVNRYPDSSWVHEIERFTGAHRHRNVRVDDQGHLVFYDPPS